MTDLLLQSLERALGVTLNALGEECITCEDCGRLVRARPEAVALHDEVVCPAARFAQVIDPEGYERLYEAV